MVEPAVAGVVVVVVAFGDDIAVAGDLHGAALVTSSVIANPQKHD